MGNRGRPPAWDEMTSRMSLESAWKAYERALIAAERSEATLRSYRLYCQRFISYVRDEEGIKIPQVTHLTPDRVRSWVLYLKGAPLSVVKGREMSRSAASYHAHVVTIKGWANFLTEQGVFPASPLSRVKNPRLPKTEVQPFTREEMRLLVGAIGSGAYSVRNRAMVFFMVSAGLRADELCNLELARVSLKDRTAIVLGKGRKERVVQFDKTAGKYLGFWLAERPEGAAGRGRVFLAAGGRPLTTGGLYQVIRALGVRAGVTRAHPHMLRHAFSVFFLEANPGQGHQLQQLLGHSTFSMTQRYLVNAQRRAPLSGPSISDIIGLR